MEIQFMSKQMGEKANRIMKYKYQIILIMTLIGIKSNQDSSKWNKEETKANV